MLCSFCRRTCEEEGVSQRLDQGAVLSPDEQGDGERGYGVLDDLDDGVVALAVEALELPGQAVFMCHGVLSCLDRALEVMARRAV